MSGLRFLIVIYIYRIITCDSPNNIPIDIIIKSSIYHRDIHFITKIGSSFNISAFNRIVIAVDDSASYSFIKHYRKFDIS